MPGKKVTVQLRRGGTRIMSERHARILVLLKKAELVSEIPEAPAPPARKAPTPRIPKAPGSEPRTPRRYVRRDLRAEE